MADDRCNTYKGASARSGCGGREPGYGSIKRGLNTKIHPTVDALGMPVRRVITDGTRADCTQASILIDGISAEYLLADKGYDSDALVDQAAAQGCVAIIPPRKHRKNKRDYDADLYKLRHLVENAFLH